MVKYSTPMIKRKHSLEMVEKNSIGIQYGGKIAADDQTRSLPPTDVVTTKTGENLLIIIIQL